MTDDYTKLPQDMLDDIGKYVCEKYDEYKQSTKRAEVRQRVKDARDSYNQVVVPATEPWDGASNMKFPLDTITVDHMTPRLVGTIVGKEPMLTMEDFGSLDKDYRDLILKFDNWILKHDMRIEKIMDPWISRLCADGQVYVLVYWNKEEIKRRDFAYDVEGKILTEQAYAQDPDQYSGEYLTPYIGMMMHEYKQVIHEGAKIQFVDFDDVFLPDRIDDWEEVTAIRRYYETWERYLYKAKQEMIRGWIKPTKDMLQKLEDALYDKRPPGSGDDLEQEDVEDRRADDDRGKLRKELLFVEGHFLWDVDGDGIQERVIARVEYNTKTLVYIRNNNELDPMNRKQLRVTTLFPEPHTGYGYGYFHKLNQVREGASSLFNMLINSALVSMIPWFIYEEGAGFEEQEPELHPGRGIKVRDADKVKFPTINANAAMFKDFLNFYIGLWERIIGLSDYSLGRESETIGKTGSTATGTMAIIQEGQIVHQYRGLEIQKQFEEIFEIIHDLYYLNMPSWLPESVLGVPMERTLMSRNYKLRLAGSTTSANKYAERAEIQEALVVGERGAQMGLVNPVPLLEMYFETIKNLDPKEVVSGPLATVLMRLFNPEEGDPYPQMVTQMSTQAPDELANAEMSRQVGEQVKQELRSKGTAIANELGAANDSTGLIQK